MRAAWRVESPPRDRAGAPERGLIGNAVRTGDRPNPRLSLQL